MARFVPDFDAIHVEVEVPSTAAAARSIADDARDGADMHELREGPWSYKPAKGDDGWTVRTFYPLAHIDEYGGPNVRSQPTGALRIAAAKHGRFDPA